MTCSCSPNGAGKVSAKRSTTAKSARPAVERDGPARDSQIEEAARQAERHAAEMEAIFAAMLDGIIIYDADGRIVRMNRIAAEILGYSPEERERPVAERLAHLRFETEPGEPLPPARNPITRALRGESVQDENYTIHPSPARAVRLRMTAAPLRNEAGGVSRSGRDR